MATDDQNVWYRLGYALERARDVNPRGALASLSERRAEGNVASRRAARPGSAGDRRIPAPRRDGDGQGGDALEALLSVGGTALAARLLGLVPSKRRPGPIRLLRAGLAGAGAAVLREWVSPLIRGRGVPTLDADALREAALAGAARGLLYGALVEPRLAGPPVVKGAAYGGVEYLVSPWGGLTALAGKQAPHRKIPVLSGLFEDIPPSEDTLPEHLAFALALAVMYGPGEREVEVEVPEGD